jgi:transposase
MLPDTLTLQHERVDDIPLLLGLMQQLHLPEILERHLGSHHLHQGIANGWLACGWMAFILSQANHCKVSVQDWAQRHQHTLQALIGQPLRPVEFSDDRLSIILRRIHDADWPALEADLWQAACQVYDVPLDCIRLDATTTCGHHAIDPDGIMQLGHSKDHRPDLPQLKLMAAAAQPSGHVLACDIHPGNAADDPLYVPLLQRVRGLIGRSGLLYAGDCKMAALATRADITAHQDYYLMPLPLVGEVQESFAAWVEAAVSGTHSLQPLNTTDEKGQESVFGVGYEFNRSCRTEYNGTWLDWQERVQVVRSLALARRQGEKLEERLHRAGEELRALTPPVGRGRRQYREESALQAAVAEVLERYAVSPYLSVHWEREEQRRKRYEGRGRGGVGRPWHWEIEVRFQVTEVRREEAAITRAKEGCGWRVQVTTLPRKDFPLLACVLLYNGGWSLERDFHVLKDAPLGIRPLYVREEEQVIGLTRLLMIALRLLTLFEMLVRAGLAEAGESLPGLYEGQPKRSTTQPTATRLLKAIARMEVTLTCMVAEGKERWHLSALPPLLIRILGLVKLSPKLYTDLAINSG